MCKYKVGDKVIVKKNIKIGKCYGMDGEDNQECMVTKDMASRAGKVVTISAVRNCGDYHRYHIEEDYWNWVDGMFEGLVEDKKVFTEKDIKTGMFGVMSNGYKFVVVNDHFVYEDGGYDNVYLDLAFWHVDKLYEGLHSFRMLEVVLNGSTDYGKLVYEYKPRYNGKVVCLDNTVNSNFYTVGKIYQLKDGQITADNGKRYPMDNIKPSKNTAKIYNFEDWEKWSTAKWLEIKE